VADFAESKVSDGTMARARLQHPTAKDISSFLLDLFAIEVTPSSPAQNQSRSVLGMLASLLRAGCRMMESPHAAFGIRIAAALLCAQIPGFLRQTQRWYTSQRGVIVSITIAACSTRTAGQSLFTIAVGISNHRMMRTLILSSSVRYWVLCLRLWGV
jgi:hypothetical protein